MSVNFRNEINLISYFWKTGKFPVFNITARNSSSKMVMLVPMLLVMTMLIYVY